MSRDIAASNPLSQDSHYRTVAKALHIALGYDSREARITALLNSPDIEVAMYAQILRANGLLTRNSVPIRPTISAPNVPFDP